jgi:23S rRNA (cytidine1920-2'-O)/16S rRNA (cytidine1409-2'-O)-methyltransferase
MRLDKELVNRKLIISRQRALSLIKSGKVKVNGIECKVPAHLIVESDTIELTEPDMKWVGRGAFKLIAAIENWNPLIKDKICLDVGASTGGFTQVLLENGAKKVFAVDTGVNQMADLIKQDKRVVNLEKTNAKYLKPEQITELVEFCVIDVSYISVTAILPGIKNVLKENAELIILIKPQFEAGREFLDKKGVLRNEKVRSMILEGIIDDFKILGLNSIRIMDSPVTGGDGNKEYFAYCKYSKSV